MPVSFAWTCDTCDRTIHQRIGKPGGWQLVYVSDPLTNAIGSQEVCLCAVCWHELSTGIRGMADLERIAAKAEPGAPSFYTAAMSTLAETFSTLLSERQEGGDGTVRTVLADWPEDVVDAVELATEGA
jgi:hypothetical protein